MKNFKKMSLVNRIVKRFGWLLIIPLVLVTIFHPSLASKESSTLVPSEVQMVDQNISIEVKNVDILGAAYAADATTSDLKVKEDYIAKSKAAQKEYYTHYMKVEREKALKAEEERKANQEEASESYTLLGSYSLTAYCPCSQCSSGTGITASGTVATVGRTVACNSLPMGTVIYIEGLGTYTVEDTGGMGRNVVDIFLGDHQSAINFGSQCATVYLVN